MKIKKQKQKTSKQTKEMGNRAFFRVTISNKNSDLKV